MLDITFYTKSLRKTFGVEIKSMKPVAYKASEYKTHKKGILQSWDFTAGTADTITAVSYIQRCKSKPCKQALCANNRQCNDCQLNNDWSLALLESPGVGLR